MLKKTNLYEEAHRRLQELLILKKEKEGCLKKVLPGKIHIANSGGRVQFYWRKETEKAYGKYLSVKKDKEIIQGLLQKQYDEKVLKQINIEIKNIMALLGEGEKAAIQIPQIYSNHSSIVKSMINPVDCSIEDIIYQWQSDPFIGKNISDSATILKTERNERVRSKSEMNIANALFRHNIPYKYECPLRLWDGQVIHPDFTVFSFKSAGIVYWEHRGMMDDRGYAKDAVNRIKDYEKSGIWLGEKLIITEETLVSPLGTDEIERVIENYLLIK